VLRSPEHVAFFGFSYARSMGMFDVEFGAGTRTYVATVCGMRSDRIDGSMSACGT